RKQAQRIDNDGAARTRQDIAVAASADRPRAALGRAAGDDAADPGVHPDVAEAARIDAVRPRGRTAGDRAGDAIGRGAYSDETSGEIAPRLDGVTAVHGYVAARAAEGHDIGVVEHRHGRGGAGGGGVNAGVAGYEVVVGNTDIAEAVGIDAIFRRIDYARIVHRDIAGAVRVVGIDTGIGRIEHAAVVDKNAVIIVNGDAAAIGARRRGADARNVDAIAGARRTDLSAVADGDVAGR